VVRRCCSGSPRSSPQRRRARLDRRAVGAIVVYGVVAMAGVQLAFFNAVRTLDVGVALLLEYLAPVLLLGWTSVRMRQRPPTATLVGAGLTLVGLAFVLDLTGGAGSTRSAWRGGSSPRSASRATSRCRREPTTGCRRW
jgi:drug/metabolite transporter (DMT)-like permease